MFMQEERSKSRRVNASLAASYKRKCGEIISASLGNISVDGCFIKTEQSIKMGEQIEVRITLPDNSLLNLSGRVMYHRPSDGFGVLFSSHGNMESSLLNMLVDLLEAKPELQSANVRNPALEPYIAQSEIVS
jgi:Tfp pilus assembly protein PilZ